MAKIKPVAPAAVFTGAQSRLDAIILRMRTRKPEPEQLAGDGEMLLSFNDVKRIVDHHLMPSDILRQAILIDLKALVQLNVKLRTVHNEKNKS